MFAALLSTSVSPFYMCIPFLVSISPAFNKGLTLLYVYTFPRVHQSCFQQGSHPFICVYLSSCPSALLSTRVSPFYMCIPFLVSISPAFNKGLTLLYVYNFPRVHQPCFQQGSHPFICVYLSSCPSVLLSTRVSPFYMCIPFLVSISPAFNKGLTLLYVYTFPRVHQPCFQQGSHPFICVYLSSCPSALLSTRVSPF